VVAGPGLFTNKTRRPEKVVDPWPNSADQLQFPSAISTSPVFISFSASPAALLLSAAKMDKRTAESPMDFEWQSRGGPGDVTSPFYQLSMQHDNKKRASRPYRVGLCCFQVSSN
jgi:hypothetical protein